MPRSTVTLCLLTLCLGATTKPTTRPAMEYGPFLSYSVIARWQLREDKTGGVIYADPMPKTELALKGISIRLDAERNVCFDTDLMRFAGAWKGGFLDLSQTHQILLKGTHPPSVDGTLELTNLVLPGATPNGDFQDPRPDHMGPLPRNVAHYDGLYVNGNNIVLSYTVGDARVLELPGTTRSSYTRQFQITGGPKTESLDFLLSTFQGSPAAFKREQAALSTPFGSIWCLLAKNSKSAELRAAESRLTLHVPLQPKATESCLVHLWWDVAGLRFPQTRPEQKQLDLSSLTKGGPTRYPPLTTKGSLGDNRSAYTLDTLTIPEKNPWNSWIRPTGLDFFSDGRAAICTLNGDVWIISGIDEKLENLTWKRFATGLYEPLGLVIKDDKIYVRGRDQITRLHDLNNDNEADFYENFNNDGAIDSGYHAFCYDLQTDSKGNFYYARGGHWYPPGRRDVDAVFRLSPDGLKTEPIANGFRVPNGIAIGPEDQIFTSDNQGNWTPTSKVNLVRPGAFHGFVADPQFEKHPVVPKSFEPPICWIPYDQDNSSGGQCFVSDPRFGPLSNHLFHTSYGKSSLFMVIYEQVGENKIPQGGVIPLNFKFDSGIMRTRVNPKDGQLYVCGIRGWQTNGNRDGCLQRIRYTGKPPHLPVAIHFRPKLIEISFTDPLDAAAASDKDSYSIEQWNYHWSSEYGSKDYSVANPAKVGRDVLNVAAARLSADQKTVVLEVPELAPVMQMKLDLNLRSADGTRISTAIYSTINQIPAN